MKSSWVVIFFRLSKMLAPISLGETREGVRLPLSVSFTVSLCERLAAHLAYFSSVALTDAIPLSGVAGVTLTCE